MLTTTDLIYFEDNPQINETLLPFPKKPIPLLNIARCMREAQGEYADGNFVMIQVENREVRLKSQSVREATRWVKVIKAAVQIARLEHRKKVRHTSVTSSLDQPGVDVSDVYDGDEADECIACHSHFGFMKVKTMCSTCNVTYCSSCSPRFLKFKILDCAV